MRTYPCPETFKKLLGPPKKKLTCTMEKEEKQQLFEDVYLLFQNGVCVCMFSSHLSFLGCV